MRRTIFTFGLVVGLLFAAGANATLIDRGGGLIYDTVLNITWTQDANLFGLADWPTQVTAANNLVFGGFDDWRLATISSTSPTTTAFDCSSGTAAACAASGNELGYMYYHNMDGIGNNTGTQTVDGVSLINVQSDYWSGTDFNPPVVAWDLLFSTGVQDVSNKEANHAAWAVRPGDVSAVPEPSTVLLLGSGLGGLALRGRILRRRRR